MKHLDSFKVFDSLSHYDRRIEYLQGRIDRYKATKPTGNNVDSEEQIRKFREELKKLRVMKKKSEEQAKKKKEKKLKE